MFREIRIEDVLNELFMSGLFNRVELLGFAKEGKSEISDRCILGARQSGGH